MRTMALMVLVAAAVLGPAPAGAQKMLNGYLTLSTTAASSARRSSWPHRATAPRPCASRSRSRSRRTDTSELEAMTQPGKPSSGIRALPDVVAVGGGLMVRAKGSIVGGIGVSGAPGGEADEACAKAGIAAISDAIESDA